jgi:hypothetical protein
MVPLAEKLLHALPTSVHILTIKVLAAILANTTGPGASIIQLPDVRQYVGSTCTPNFRTAFFFYASQPKTIDNSIEDAIRQ